MINKLINKYEKKSWRKQNSPELTYNYELPITDKKDEIIDFISKNQVLIISGETGSGKTTQIPKYCIAAGRGVDGKIGCTQPRRIAATTVARRIAEELGGVYITPFLTINIFSPEPSETYLYASSAIPSSKPSCKASILISCELR